MNLLRTMPVTMVSAVACVVALAVLAIPSRAGAWMKEALFVNGPAADRRLSVLDFLRGSAALYVFFFHLWQWNQPHMDALVDLQPWVRLGTKGVAIFACLSGYLIYGICSGLQSLDDLKGFVVRRIRRIYPLYAATTVVMLVLGLAGLKEWIVNLLMLPVLGIGAPANGPAWSIYVEEIFYATCLMLVGLIRTLKHKLWTLGSILAVLLIVGAGEGSRELRLWPYFLVGILAWEARRTWAERLSAKIGWMLLFAGGCLVVADALLNADVIYTVGSAVCRPLLALPHGRGGGDPLGEYTADLAVGMLLVIFSATSVPAIDAFFRSKAFRFLATISYGVYLNQTLVLREHGDGSLGVLPYLILKTAAIVGVSIVTYLLIERPCLGRPQRASSGVAASSSA